MDEEFCLDLCIGVAERSGLNLRVLLEAVRGLDRKCAETVLANLVAMPVERLPRVAAPALLPSHS